MDICPSVLLIPRISVCSSVPPNAQLTLHIEYRMRIKINVSISDFYYQSN